MWLILPILGVEADRPQPRLAIPDRRIRIRHVAAYALARTMGRGSFGLLNVALLVTAVFGLGLFALAEAKAASPLIQLSLFRNPRLSAGFAMSTLVTTVVMATLAVGLLPVLSFGSLCARRSPGRTGHVIRSNCGLAGGRAGWPHCGSVWRTAHGRARRR